MDRMSLLVLGALAISFGISTASTTAEPAVTVERRIDRWQPFIAEAAVRFAIPEVWIRAVIRAESGGRTILDGRPITSPAGAMGLMQLMPETYAEMRRHHRLGADPYEPRDNILAGTAYLRAMYERFGFPGLFAAYNAGPSRYNAYLAGSESLPRETRAFLAALDPSVAAGVTATRTRLFFQLGSITTPHFELLGVPSSDRLFVPLHTVPDSDR